MTTSCGCACPWRDQSGRSGHSALQRPLQRVDRRHDARQHRRRVCWSSSGGAHAADCRHKAMAASAQHDSVWVMTAPACCQASTPSAISRPALPDAHACRHASRPPGWSFEQRDVQVAHRGDAGMTTRAPGDRDPAHAVEKALLSRSEILDRLPICRLDGRDSGNAVDVGPMVHPFLPRLHTVGWISTTRNGRCTPSCSVTETYSPTLKRCLSKRKIGSSSSSPGS